MKRTILLLISLLTFSSLSWAGHRIHGEFGITENSYNQVQISGDDGTRFNMRKSFRKDEFFFRLDYKMSFDNRHGFRLLYAPLRLKGAHRYDKNIDFNGEVFIANSETSTTYQFNSYRASYFYQLIDETKWKLYLGITGKIRDASIELKQGNKKEKRSDLGIVPLFYLWTEYWLTNDFKMTFDFDGLAAPQGRAFDMALMLGYKLSPSVNASLGYRILEGGVDNDKVYNFSQFNYGFSAIEVTF